MSKKALIAVSFGTVCPEARRAIGCVERALAAARPEHDFFRAFTSRVVAARIEREQGEQIPDVSGLLERLAATGYDEVICQSLHIIAGLEYEKLCALAAPFQTRFARLQIGLPLLHAPRDFLRCSRALLSHMPKLSRDEAFVWMGHGTAHFAGASYALLENTLRADGAERVYIATVEGLPNFDYALRRLHAREISRVHLAPLMLVAGDHAQNDLAGEDEESWKSVLLREGYEVCLHMKGMGEFSEIADIFASHLP